MLILYSVVWSYAPTSMTIPEHLHHFCCLGTFFLLSLHFHHCRWYFCFCCHDIYSLYLLETSNCNSLSIHTHCSLHSMESPSQLMLIPSSVMIPGRMLHPPTSYPPNAASFCCMSSCFIWLFPLMWHFLVIFFQILSRPIPFQPHHYILVALSCQRYGCHFIDV